MIIVRLCAIAAVTAICALILKSHKSELAPLCVAAGGILMVLFAFDYIAENLQLLKEFTATTGISSSVVRVIFKIIGIGYIVELTASSVKDLGYESIADKLIMCGRIVIFIVSVPVLQSLYDVIVSLIELV